jgi:hypothetical protein
LQEREEHRTLKVNAHVLQRLVCGGGPVEQIIKADGLGYGLPVLLAL